MLESQTVKAKKGLQIIQSNSLIHRHPPWGAGTDQRPTIRTKLESDSWNARCKCHPNRKNTHGQKQKLSGTSGKLLWTLWQVLHTYLSGVLAPWAAAHDTTVSTARRQGKSKGLRYCVPQLTKQDTASSQIRYARNFKAREAFLALKASGSLRRIKGTGEVPGSLGTLTWWWNSTSSSSWTPQNSHGMTTLSSTGGELLKPIKDSNWSLADCRISFWKITSGSSTPRGEVLPTLSGGKAHEGLQLVCLKKHRLKQNKKKRKKEKTQKLRNKLNSENIFRKSQHFHNA